MKYEHPALGNQKFPIEKDKPRVLLFSNYIPEIQKRKSTDVLGTLHPTSF